jgi:hypothetical protein
VPIGLKGFATLRPNVTKCEDCADAAEEGSQEQMAAAKIERIEAGADQRFVHAGTPSR